MEHVRRFLFGSIPRQMLGRAGFGLGRPNKAHWARARPISAKACWASGRQVGPFPKLQICRAQARPDPGVGLRSQAQARPVGKVGLGRVGLFWARPSHGQVYLAPTSCKLLR